jgi:uncharacterized Fe-S center protein
MPSKVVFTDMRTKPGNNLLDKLKRVMIKAGIEKMDLKDKTVALKIHFGEPGNLAYIRPNYVKVIVDKVKELGGKPFLTDCNTLYYGMRSNAIDHLQAAMENGFNRIAVGCDVIIADGLTGTDTREIEIDQELVEKAKIGTVIADADVIISINHFKGHEQTGFGGALKNLGMGCGSRKGKMEMHSASKPFIEENDCVSCGMCIKNCPEKAISYNKNRKAVIDYEKCIGCGQCVASCHYGAARAKYDQSVEILNKKIAEYALAVLRGKQHFHVSFMVNISPDCDCWDVNDQAIAPDVGIASSFDPVALDRACVDLVNAAPAILNSRITDKGQQLADGADKFVHVHPDIHWKEGLEHAEKIKVGTQNYVLTKVS